MTSLTFHADGVPGAQGSKNAHAVKRAGVYTGRVAVTESSVKVKPWRAAVEAAARDAAQLVAWPTCEGPVSVRLAFRITRPRSHYRTGRFAHLLRDDAPAYPVQLQHGDVDKLQRSTFDALTAAKVIADDKLIVSVTAQKLWTQDTDRPGATIRITVIP